MENFIVSARKYRPSTFNSVVGQKNITTTLKNSLKKSQLAHAYLFCGPRGVGKTTCARIFAKTINCKNRTDDYEACNECESCLAFNESRSYNIHELDAASNNSVEDIRNLIEQVRIPPQIGTHSVYIIDEVHMLSSQAFNAFLKTLEEPPEHAIFVLATTEKHKILPTILSRCQIFDFNRIKVEDAVEHLNYVAENEGIEADKDALNVIAQKADGAMRDALSFFDQIVSFSGKKITYQNAIDNLNVLDYDYYFDLVEAFLNNDLSMSLLTFNKILDKGFDGHHFITGLSGHLRDLLVCKDTDTLELLEVGATIRDKYKKQSELVEIGFILKALDISNTTDLAYKASKNKRLQVELALMKMCNITNVVAEKEKQTEDKIDQKKTESVQKQEESTTNKAMPVSIKAKTSGISLNKKVEQKKPIDDKINASEISENKNYTQKELNSVWKSLAEGLKSKPRLYGIINSAVPNKVSDSDIEISVSTELVKDKLEEIKTKFVSYLRKNLHNSNINLLITVAVVEEEESDEKKLYTDEDKYSYLSEKNENLDKFKDKMGLDF